MSDDPISGDVRIIRIESGEEGSDELVHAYLETNRSSCAFHVLFWPWVLIGLLAGIAGGLIGNQLAGPLAPPEWAAPGSAIAFLHPLLGQMWPVVTGMIGGTLVASILGGVLKAHRVSAAHEPLVSLPFVIIIYLGLRDPLVAISVVTGLMCTIYIAAILFRLVALLAAGGNRGMYAGALPEPVGGWPVYTILVPLYRETEVADKILKSLEDLDYPRDKLDVKLLLEGDDPATLDAVINAGTPSWIEAVIVPDSQPKTKPRACNHGLQLARGEFLVIYDAEDRPEPDQLKQAVLAYHRLGKGSTAPKRGGFILGCGLIVLGLALLGEVALTPLVGMGTGLVTMLIHVGGGLAAGIGAITGGVFVAHASRGRGPVACLQAHLAYHNHAQNLLTRWFALEYNVWFARYLPGLVTLGGPIPLGGTSNHFRTDVLHELHGWDPFNVTEDCDLGIRLYMGGYRTRIIDSVTWEEANSRVGNWLRQRSRWIKGYLVTHCVWLRHPFQLLLRLGPWGTLCFLVSIFGVGGLSVLNLPLWIALITFLALFGVDLVHGYGPWELLASSGDLASEHARVSWQMVFLGRDQDPWWSVLSIAFFATSATLFAANFLFVAINLWGGRRPGQRGLVLPALLTPFYWVLISLGAWKGFWQMLFKPHYWEKTLHGLDADTFDPADDAPSAQGESMADA